jgi:hypothetical protein
MTKTMGINVDTQYTTPRGRPIKVVEDTMVTDLLTRDGQVKVRWEGLWCEEQQLG